MKERIDNLLLNQLNMILKIGNNELLSSEYLSFIISNYDFLIKLNHNKSDKNVINSLSELVSHIK